jgi:hypothetical protein
MDAVQPVMERVRAFLASLPESACATLLGQLEKAELAGQFDPKLGLVADELRKIVRRRSRAHVRPGTPTRLFAAPLDPFFVNTLTSGKTIARIPRSEANRVWVWMARDLMPDEWSAFGAGLLPYILSDDRAGAEALADRFRVRFVERAGKVLDEARRDEREQMKLAGRLGGLRTIEELADILTIMRGRGTLAALAQRLPQTLRQVGDEQTDNLTSLLENAAILRNDLFEHALVMLAKRLDNPAYLARIAVRIAETDEAAKLVLHRYGAAISLVLSEIERWAADLGEHVAARRFAEATQRVKGLHDTVRLLRTDVDFSGESPFSRRLATARATIARDIGRSLEPVPGQVRRILRLRGGSAMMETDSDIDEADAALEFLGVCRSCAAELAVNEITLRVYAEVQQSLEAGTNAVIDAIRQGHPAGHDVLVRQARAAVRFCTRVFGASYGTLLAKSVDVALAAERKSA